MNELTNLVRTLASQRMVQLTPEDQALLTVIGSASRSGSQQLLWSSPAVASICAEATAQLRMAARAPQQSPAPVMTGAAGREHVTTRPEPTTASAPSVAPVVTAANNTARAVPAQAGADGQMDHSAGPATSFTEPLVRPPDPQIEQRAALLTAWRDEQAARDSRFGALSSWDINILAESGATSMEQIWSLADRVNAAALVQEQAASIAAALSDQPPAGSSSELPAAPAPEPRSDGQWVNEGGFAACDLSEIVSDEVVLAGIQVSAEDGMHRLQWAPVETDDAFVLYRVVEHASRWERISPDDGRTVGVTDVTEVVTGRLNGRLAVSYLTVWANTGADEASARASQGRVIAQGEVLWPISDLKLSVTPANTVVGSVTARPGTSLMVLRFEPGEPVRNDSSHALTDANIGENGFVDRRPPPAVDLTYAVFSVVNLPNHQRRMSDSFVTGTVHVEVEPVPVDIEVRENTQIPGTWDIAWTDPGFGQVEIYLTDEPVPHGLGEGSRTRDVLVRNGLRAEDKVPGFVVRQGGSSMIAENHIPASWVRSYFTAVHVVGEDCVRVGQSISKVTPAPPREVRLAERVDSQTLTFEWPRGVSMVEVHRTPRDQTTFDATSTQNLVESIDSPETYLRRGGLPILGGLPAHGCALHLVGVIYDNGVAMRSQPATIQYDGLTRLEYRLVPARTDGAQVSPSAPADHLLVQVRADNEIPQVAVVLVAGDGRLPLYPGDGEHVADAIRPVSSESAFLPFRVPLRQREGFLRLFVTSPELVTRVAVIDPSLRDLYVKVLQ